MERNEKKIRFIELFAGAGGFRLGLENITKAQGIQQGISKKCRDIKSHNILWMGTKQFTCIWANDIDKKACETYRKNFGSKELREGDIRKIKSIEIPDFDLLTGGFPCQSFSIAGRREGFQDRTKGTLFFEILRILRDKRPEALLLENVKGLLSHDGGRTFAIILLSLAELRYNVQWQIINTKYFLPQNRERIFIVGFRERS
jgi:DNA (cytosine-5)-methyltransferase 1